MGSVSITAPDKIVEAAQKLKAHFQDLNSPVICSTSEPHILIIRAHQPVLIVGRQVDAIYDADPVIHLESGN